MVKMPRLRPKLLLAAVALVTIGTWAYSSPALHFHWFRLRGEPDRAWEVAVRHLPSEPMERRLAELLVDRLESEDLPIHPRRRMILTLGCLPRARSISLETLERQLASPNVCTEACIALRGLPPVSTEVIERLAHEVREQARRDPADERARAFLISFSSWPVAFNGDDPLLVLARSSQRMALPWPQWTDRFELMGAGRSPAAMTLAELVVDLELTLEVRATAGEQLILLAADAVPALPLLRRVFRQTDPQTEKLILWVIGRLEDVARDALPELRDPEWWSQLHNRDAPERLELTLAAAMTLALTQPEDADLAPAVDALEEFFRHREDLDPVQFSDAVRVAAAMGERTHSFHSHLHAGVERSNELVTMAVRAAAREPDLYWHATDPRLYWNDTPRLAARVLLQPHDLQGQEELLELFSDAGRLLALYRTDLAGDALRTVPRSPRPTWRAQLHSESVEARAEAGNVLARFGVIDEELIDELWRLHDEGHRAVLGLALSHRPTARRLLREIARHPETLEGEVLLPWRTPWFLRRNLWPGLPHGPRMSLQQLLAVLPPDEIPGEVIAWIEAELERVLSSSIKLDPAMIRDLLGCIELCGPESCARVEDLLLRELDRNYDGTGRHLTVALGLAQLGAPPRAWIPELFESLRSDPRPPERAVEVLQNHEW